MYNRFRNCFDEFINNIKELEKFIEIEKSIKNFAQNFQEITKSNIKREIKDNFSFLKGNYYNDNFYNGFIIGLYGSFERYIDEILDLYISTIIANINNFNENDTFNKIVKKFKDESFSFLQNNSQYDTKKINENLVIDNLKKIIDCDKKGIINYLVIKHPANLNVKQIKTLFSQLDLEFEKIKNLEIFKKYYMDVSQNSENLEVSSSSEIVFNKLSNIVDERNIIAHSGESRDNRINKEEHIEFIKVFSEAILILVVEKVYKILSEENKLIKLKTRRFHKFILGLEEGNISLTKETKLFYKDKNHDKNHGISSINNIRKEDKDVEEISDTGEYGLSLDVEVKQNYEYYFYEDLI